MGRMDDAARLEALGPRLRRMRATRGLTLADVSVATGVSPSTLSRVETGARIPSLEVLLPLVREYRVTLDEALGLAAQGAATPRHGRDRFIPLTRGTAGLRAFKQVIPGDSVIARPAQGSHDGFEWLYVLSGRLRLALGGDVLDLDAGEAAEFDTRVPHGTASADGHPVEVLALFGPQGERMHVRARSEPRTTRS